MTPCRSRDPGDGRILGQLPGPAAERRAKREERHERDPALDAQLEHVLAGAIDDAVGVLHLGDVDELERAPRTSPVPASLMPIRSSLPSLAHVLERAELLRERSRRGALGVVDQTEVDEVHPLHPQRAEVVLHPDAQLGRTLCAAARRPAPSRRRADLGDELQVLGVRIQRLADQIVHDVGAVVLRGVDVVHAEFDRAPQHRANAVRIARRPEHAGAGELHRAEADAVDGLVANEGCLVHAHSLRREGRGSTRGPTILGCDTTSLGPSTTAASCWTQRSRIGIPKRFSEPLQ